MILHHLKLLTKRPLKYAVLAIVLLLEWSFVVFEQPEQKRFSHNLQFQFHFCELLTHSLQNILTDTELIIIILRKIEKIKGFHFSDKPILITESIYKIIYK